MAAKRTKKTTTKTAKKSTTRKAVRRKPARAASRRTVTRTREHTVDATTLLIIVGGAFLIIVLGLMIFAKNKPAAVSGENRATNMQDVQQSSEKVLKTGTGQQSSNSAY